MTNSTDPFQTQQMRKLIARAVPEHEIRRTVDNLDAQQDSEGGEG